MFKHLLVTLDGTPRGESVIPHAADLARAMGAEITLLRVVESAGSDWNERGAIGRGSADTTIPSQIAERARTYLERIASHLSERGVRANAIVRQGHPARQIISVAKELDVDAIAMATHPRRGLNRLMSGSIAEQVLHESSLPLLLVHAA